jgi:hypothetical protein
MGITWGPSFPCWDLWKSLVDSCYLTIFFKLLHSWWTNIGWWSASKVQVDGSSNPLNRHRHPNPLPNLELTLRISLNNVNRANCQLLASCSGSMMSNLNTWALYHPWNPFFVKSISVFQSSH